MGSISLLLCSGHGGNMIISDDHYGITLLAGGQWSDGKQ